MAPQEDEAKGRGAESGYGQRERAGRRSRRRRSLYPNTGRKAKIRARLVARDGSRCALCGLEIDLTLPRDHDFAATIDHINEVAQGGKHQLCNLRLAHRICNLERSGQRLR